MFTIIAMSFVQEQLITSNPFETKKLGETEIVVRRGNHELWTLAEI